MSTGRRQTLVMVAVVGALLAAVAVLWVGYRRSAAERETPSWTDPQQPADQVAPLVAGAEQSWAANRARPMTASCGDNSAGRRTRRTYPATLSMSLDSMIGGIDAFLDGSVDC